MLRSVLISVGVVLLAFRPGNAEVPPENLRCGSLQSLWGTGPYVLYTVSADSIFVLTDISLFASPNGPCQYQVGDFMILSGVGGTALWSETFHWVLDDNCHISDDRHVDQHWSKGLPFRAGQSLVVYIEASSPAFASWRGGWAGYVMPAGYTSSSELRTAPPPRDLLVSPNPGSESVTINFGLIAPNSGSVAIYDVQGRCVRILLSGAMTEGEHSLTWDGLDEHGSPVASGTYFARLDVGDRLASGKINYVRD
jgi:hypothetical protein